MLERGSALAGHPLLQTGDLVPGADPGVAPVTVVLRPPFSLLQVSAFRSTVQHAGARLADLLALELPAPNRYSGPVQCNLRAVGPGVWQVLADPGAAPEVAALRAALAGVASVVDLGHARIGLQVRGPAAARTMAKFCQLDLEETRFPVGSATLTGWGSVGIGLARTGNAPDFELLLPRAYACSLFEALVDAGREFGLAVMQDPTGAWMQEPAAMGIPPAA